MCHNQSQPTILAVINTLTAMLTIYVDVAFSKTPCQQYMLTAVFYSAAVHKTCIHPMYIWMREKDVVLGGYFFDWAWPLRKMI